MKNKRTQRIFQIVLAISTITSLFFVPWILVWAWLKPLPENVQNQADEALNYGFKGIIVCVDKKGNPPTFYTAGYHDSEKKIPVRADAYFKIASVSKLYTAVAITKLVNDGLLSLDESLSKYLPELKDRIEYADEITLRMLVKHRSGIPNYTSTLNYWANPKESSDENLALVLDQPANFKPDKDYQYCNTNYLLLAKVMDEVLGYNHFQFIQDEILIPLNLNHTFSSVKDVNIKNVMSGYYVGYPHDLKTDDQGMVATAEDLSIFLRALNDSSVFESGKEAIYTSLYEYNHKGLVPGYQTIAEYHEEIDAVVIQFTNTTNFEGYEWNLSEIVYNRVVKILKEDKSNF
jgi:CubicO group peptidase (beta-lactamase class C family)